MSSIMQCLKVPALLVFSMLEITAIPQLALANSRFDEPFEVMNSTPAWRSYRQATEKRIYKNLTSPEQTHEPVAHKGARATMLIHPDGKIKDVWLSESSGKTAADFACFEAILSASPLPSPPVEKEGSSCTYRFTPGPQRETIDFYETNMPKYFHIEKAPFSSNQFFETNPKLKGQFALIHLIPVDVLQRYPGLFTEVELTDLANLKPVPLQGLIEIGKDFTTQRFLLNPDVKAFFSDWESFFEIHRSSTKKEVLSFSKTLLTKYPNLFN